ncbi:MAG: LEA type 2 family protein [Bacteroidales bacterium]|nr:LEA type 2 family protein [Bacteroidales bacterium]
MKKKLLWAISWVAAITMGVMVASCSMLQGLSDQMFGLANLANCEFSMKNVSDVSVGGVNLKNVKNGNLSVTDIAKLTAAVLANNVPLAMNVNVDVKNPTTTNAALTAMDWILDIDGTQFASGTNATSYTIPKNATTTVPLNVNTDVYSLFKNVNSLKTFVQSFSGDGTSSKVGIRIKPSINVGGVTVPMPDYIKLEKKTGSVTTTTSATPKATTGNTSPKGSGFKTAK